MALLKKKQQDWLERPQQQQQQAPYAPAQSVAQAQQAYQNVAGQKPADYVGQYQQQMQQLFGKIQDRKPFSYDLNADALYQQYKDQYTRMGKMAMQDTMGQAATMTGGYGNSYANTAGNQAYQGYLQRLNEMVPQLEDRAHARYQAEGQDLYQQYGLAAQADQMDYGRYQDAVARWRDERDTAYGQYRDEQGFDYGQYRDAIGDSQWQQGFDFNRERADVADSQWQTQFDYGQQRDAVGDQRYAEQDAYTRFLNEQQQGNWQAQFEYSKQSDQQKQDFGLAMAAIQAGQTPSAELLARAGIDGETARLLAGIFSKPKSTGGTGSNNKTTFDPNAIINVYRAEGTARLDQELENALRNNTIKPEEAAALRQFTISNVQYTKDYMVHVAPDISKVNTKLPASYQQMLEESLKKLKK